MLTAHNPNTAPPDAGETTHRPTRLLVPTLRRTDYYLTPDDTLRAADLGITRTHTIHTLRKRIPQAAQHDPYRSDPLTHLIRLRNGLAQPRDINEAREWGLHIPDNENTTEHNPTPSKRLGWWIVYDPTRTETRTERQHRYLTDQRRVDTKGMSAILGRSYYTVRDTKVATDTARAVLADIPGARQRAIEKFRRENPGYPGTDKQLTTLLIDKAHETILLGTPPPIDMAGQSDLFLIADVLKTGRTTKRLDEWYEPVPVKQTGRPIGSRTRRWRKTTT